MTKLEIGLTVALIVVPFLAVCFDRWLRKRANPEAKVRPHVVLAREGRPDGRRIFKLTFDLCNVGEGHAKGARLELRVKPVEAAWARSPGGELYAEGFTGENTRQQGKDGPYRKITAHPVQDTRALHFGKHERCYETWIDPDKLGDKLPVETAIQVSVTAEGMAGEWQGWFHLRREHFNEGRAKKQLLLSAKRDTELGEPEELITD